MRSNVKIFMLALLFGIVLIAGPAVAQCPMCKAAVTNAEEGEKVARSLNLGILVLLLPPVGIFCSIFYLAYKSKNADERNDYGDENL